MVGLTIMVMKRRCDVTLITTDDTIYTLCTAHPQAIGLLADFGFTQIRQSMMIQTVGRYMTLRKGCEMRGFDLESLVSYLQSHGVPMEEMQ